MSGGTEAGIRFLSDTNGVLSTALGLVKVDGMMIRTKRFSLIANDGIVTHYFSSVKDSSDTWAPNLLSAL
jgi:2-Cys peroxiredoxin 5